MTQYEITFPIRRPWVAVFLFLLILPFRPYLLMVFLLLRGVIRPQSPAEFFSCLIIGIPFLLVGFFFGGTWLRLILTSLFGREMLKVEEGRLMLREALFGMGRWRSYAADSIRGISGGRLDLQRFAREQGRIGERMKLADTLRWQRILSGLEGGLRFLGVWPALIFRVNGAVTWFGLGMEESQSQEILARLRMHLPESAF